MWGPQRSMETEERPSRPLFVKDQSPNALQCWLAGLPIGASGLRMLYEMYLQLQGRAGARQLKDPRIGMTHNLGGAPRENVSSVAIVGRYE